MNFAGLTRLPPTGVAEPCTMCMYMCMLVCVCVFISHLYIFFAHVVVI